MLAHAPGFRLCVDALTVLAVPLDDFKDKFRCSNGKQYANNN